MGSFHLIMRTGADSNTADGKPEYIFSAEGRDCYSGEVADALQRAAQQIRTTGLPGRGPGKLQSYRIAIDYRTCDGIRTTTVEVCATSADEAYKLASDRIRARRGTRKIDGGHHVGQPIDITP